MTTKLMSVQKSAKHPLLSGEPKLIIRNPIKEQDEDLARGLVAYFNDDGKSAATWLDMVNYPNGKNNGTIYGAGTPPPATPGALGYTFDGIDDYVDAGNNTSLDITGAITLGAWVKILLNQTGDIVTKNGGTVSTIQYELDYLVGGTLRMRGSNGTVLYSATKSNIVLNTWYCVVGTYENSVFKVYINSVKGADATLVGTKSITTESVSIGARNPSAPLLFFNGSIDEVRICNRALSQGEITKLFNLTRGKFGI